MQILLIVLIFFLTLFFYLHINFHLKTSDDLEIFDIDQPSKEKLEEICDMRQPVLFKFNFNNGLDLCRRQAMLETYGAFDMKRRTMPTSDSAESYTATSLRAAHGLLQGLGLGQAQGQGLGPHHLFESNQDFLEETTLIKCFKYNDSFLRPPMVCDCAYDILLASPGTQTPFKYEINYRNYFVVLEGNTKIKLAPPKSSKYLFPLQDYELLEFRSPVNPWQVQPMYAPDFSKVKCLEFALTPGQVFFIPAYWWYSVEFGEETTVCTFKYRTFMNQVAIAPHLFTHVLQTQNVKRNMLNRLNTEEAPATATATATGPAPATGLENNINILPVDAVANVVGANLGGANVVGANVVGANVVGANVVGANIVGANVVGANVVGANVVGANII
jgi:hypothetical protein